MSEADKLFLELGYIKHKIGFYPNNMEVLYGRDKDDKRICFWKNQTIEVYDFYDGSRDFTMQELKAINMKCKELRME